jgi:hypothetical protein
MLSDPPSSEDPLMPLLMEAMMRLLTGDGKWPITWVVGDTWVVYHGPGDWKIGPDEPATGEQVRELMLRAGGVFELQDF